MHLPRVGIEVTSKLIKRRHPRAQARESRTDRMSRRIGESAPVCGEGGTGSGRPRRAAAAVSAYGERRASSSESNSDQWVSNASEDEGNKLAEPEDEADFSDHVDDVQNTAEGTEQGAKGASARQHKLILDDDAEDERAVAGAAGQGGSRRRVIDQEEEDGESVASGETGKEGREQAPGARVVESNDKGAIAVLVRNRERQSWIGKTVSKHFRGYGAFLFSFPFFLCLFRNQNV